MKDLHGKSPAYETIMVSDLNSRPNEVYDRSDDDSAPISQRDARESKNGGQVSSVSGEPRIAKATIEVKKINKPLPPGNVLKYLSDAERKEVRQNRRQLVCGFLYITWTITY